MALLRLAEAVAEWRRTDVTTMGKRLDEMDTMTVTTRPAAAPADDALVMAMLHDHVPLALLCDLTATGGPTSREILDTEGEPAQRWWE